MHVVRSLGHDLPPSWDGRRVEWLGWSESQTSARFHRKAGEHGCPCGEDGEPSVNLGLVHPVGGDTVTVIRERTLKRSGRKVSREVDVPAWPLIHLAAFRCLSCGHDQVWDQRTDEWWDLDESDYGNEGSVDGALPGL